jgi:hypothetical protein
MNWICKQFPAMAAAAVAALPCGAEEIFFQQGASPTTDYAHHAVTVRSQYPDSTAGGAGDLHVGNNAPGHAMRAVLSFDLSAIPGGAKIEKVEIDFRQAADAASAEGPVDLVLLEYYGFVSEGHTSWQDTQGQFGPPLGIVRMKPRAGVRITFRSSDGMVAAAQEALDFGFTLGFALRLRNEGHAGRLLVLLRGNEYSAEASRPKLTVHYSVPN